ncbi:MAG: peptidase C1 [Gammaproteobacteria bacterium]|nr:peptidase C1 [Gammaproteobacteria bacterium]
MNSILSKTCLVLLSVQLCFANNISLNITTNPELTPHHISQSKTLEFELIKISPRSRLAIIKQINNPGLGSQASTLPSKQALGMANVPVLDQGQHGSCVTFAITASLDALNNLGNYYSQLCFLQHGSYLYQQGEGLSGWDGLNGYTAFKRITTYGLMNKTQQKTYGCGGLTTYPLYAENTGEMSTVDYKLYAEIPQFKQQLLFTNLTNASNKTNGIKQSLNAGHRVLMSTLFVRADLGVVGAIAQHRYHNDTWVLSDDIINEIKNQRSFPGHMMIVTGYDDTLIAVDNNGKEHKGLFILRNSWGKYIGDFGTFYMSYDYMNALAQNAYALKRPAVA